MGILRAKKAKIDQAFFEFFFSSQRAERALFKLDGFCPMRNDPLSLSAVQR